MRAGAAAIVAPGLAFVAGSCPAPTESALRNAHIPAEPGLGRGEVVDEDLDHMSREQLIGESKRLRAWIRNHRDSSGHELCWHHPALWGLLPEKQDPLPVVPEWPEFLRGCIHYRQSLDEQLPDAPRSHEPHHE